MGHSCGKAYSALEIRLVRSMSTITTAEVAIVGAGPAGLAVALALAALGVDVTLLAPPYDVEKAQADRRTTALMASSVLFLENLGVWGECGRASAPLDGIRIVDDRGGLLRAPEILFRAGELGLQTFGANIANAALVQAMQNAAAASPRVRWIPTAAVTSAACGSDTVTLKLAEGGAVEASLAVAADGRGSVVRGATGIPVDTWAYPQAAMGVHFTHTRRHENISTELHRRAGPLTVVPLPDLASGLVWVEEPDEARRLAALPDRAFAAELQERLQGLLGRIEVTGPRGVFPLGGMRARQMGARRVALVGEAAHVLPPIGAQGLNLGLRDAAVLAEEVADARARGEDAGGPAVLEAYGRARHADVLTRTVSVDLLNRSLLADLVPVQALRGVGLHVLAGLAPLRRLAMRGGMGPLGALPRLMRPQASAGP
jgi:2-octaprenyl-6-methoxyphenol hydroxylase